MSEWGNMARTRVARARVLKLPIHEALCSVLFNQSCRLLRVSSHILAVQ